MYTLIFQDFVLVGVTHDVKDVTHDVKDVTQLFYLSTNSQFWVCVVCL